MEKRGNVYIEGSKNTGSLNKNTKGEGRINADYFFEVLLSVNDGINQPQ